MAYLGYRSLLVTAFSVHKSSGKPSLTKNYLSNVERQIANLKGTVSVNVFDVRVNNVYQSEGATVLHTIFHINFESKKEFHLFKLMYPLVHDYLSLMGRHADENLQLMRSDSEFIDRTELVKEKLDAYF